jgi:hypothetical protein
MRLKASAGVSCIGLLDIVHVFSNWTELVIPAQAPVWVAQYASAFATVVLVLATWFVVPAVCGLIRSLLDWSLSFHKYVNRSTIQTLLAVVRFGERNLHSLETTLESAAGALDSASLN